MTPKGYTVLGWIVWQVARRFIRFKVKQNNVKLGAAATVALVLIAGVVAARASSND